MTIHETKINENSYFYINRFAEEHNYNRCCYKSGRTWYYETPANYYKALRRAVKKELLKKRTNRQAFVSSISEQKIGVRIKLENNY
tara:strand:- start:6583 stop:6840 length:258 start_codon:yes stop_codon:yes gene_type:complete